MVSADLLWLSGKSSWSEFFFPSQLNVADWITRHHLVIHITLVCTIIITIIIITVVIIIIISVITIFIMSSTGLGSLVLYCKWFGIYLSPYTQSMCLNGNGYLVLCWHTFYHRVLCLVLFCLNYTPLERFLTIILLDLISILIIPNLYLIRQYLLCDLSVQLLATTFDEVKSGIGSWISSPLAHHRCMSVMGWSISSPLAHLRCMTAQFKITFKHYLILLLLTLLK